MSGEMIGASLRKTVVRPRRTERLENQTRPDTADAVLFDS